MRNPNQHNECVAKEVSKEHKGKLKGTFKSTPTKVKNNPDKCGKHTKP